MSEEHVHLDTTRAGVAMITLNRPELHNALNAEVIEQMNAILEDLRGADGVRIVFLRGAGPSFCAGADLEWMKAAAHYTYNDNVEDAKNLAEMLHRLDTLPQATIALVDGAVRGGGNGLVAACDLAIAVKRATFAFSEVKLGLAPSTISPYVVRAIGPRAARRLFVTADVIDAAEAFRLGLVDKVVDDESDFSREEERLARQLFANAPEAIAACKELVQMVADHPIDKALRDHTAQHIAKRRATDEGREGTAAFLEKRKPEFKGK